MKTTEVKERIMATTIALIEECDSIENVTIRDIAAKTGVGVGLINYHFQTKDNLINQCVQKIIGNIINKFEVMSQGVSLEPIEKLRFLIKATCTFLATNQGVSRVSILSDLVAGTTSDNTSQTINAYLPVVRSIFEDTKTDTEIYISTHILISTLQSAFLRSEVLLQSVAVDFYDKEQRDQFIDKVIERIFQ
ncbi:TetR/AcrR family transcriptional regulator [Neobacillus sp. LXY-4]|uniref:TetR/AcrR family transcriptional regulator n=1 Tax=Neobacillus sp. LXY-4 TaxID=3379826 RepID=UPI003EDEF8C0